MKILSFAVLVLLGLVQGKVDYDCMGPTAWKCKNGCPIGKVCMRASKKSESYCYPAKCQQFVMSQKHQKDQWDDEFDSEDCFSDNSECEYSGDCEG